MWPLSALPPKVLLPKACLADSPMHAVFDYLSTVEIHTELSVIESEAESVGSKIVTAVCAIPVPYRPRMSEIQDRQCTHNITLRRVCAAFVAVEKQ